jgi:hypothetical protein
MIDDAWCHGANPPVWLKPLSAHHPDIAFRLGAGMPAANPVDEHFINKALRGLLEQTP